MDDILDEILNACACDTEYDADSASDAHNTSIYANNDESDNNTSRTSAVKDDVKAFLRSASDIVDDDDIEVIAETRVNEGKSFLTAASKNINELIFMESATTVAAANGVHVRTRKDLQRFMRSEMLSRKLEGKTAPVRAPAPVHAPAHAPSHALVRAPAHVREEESIPQQHAPIMPIVPIMPIKRFMSFTPRTTDESSQKDVEKPIRAASESTDNIPYVSPRVKISTELRTKKAKTEYVNKLLDDGFKLTKSPLMLNGMICETIYVKCQYGHEHQCKTDYVIEHRLSTCHTCKCRDLIINKARYHLERITGYPTILEGNSTLCCKPAKIIVYIVAPNDNCKLWRTAGTLHINVPYCDRIVEKLTHKMGQSTFTLPDKRKVRDVAKIPSIESIQTDADRPSDIDSVPVTLATDAQNDAPHNVSIPHAVAAHAAPQSTPHILATADLFGGMRITPSIASIFSVN